MSLVTSTMKTSCAEKVASIDDIIIEILLYLPASSLLRFKSVSKHWLSLITSPHFSRLHISHQPLGLLIQISRPLEPYCREKLPQYSYMYTPLSSSSEEPRASRTITFPSPLPDGMKIIQSCNGLLLCGMFSVYNPTTNKFTTIPYPPLTGGYMMAHCTTLAFDPSRSPHYKLVYVHCFCSGIYQIMVYSSETQLWSVCRDQPLENSYKTHFFNGVYLNGAVHWTNFNDTSSIYLMIDEERIETMPMPLIPNNNRYIYFGESGGRLHLITVNDRDNAADLVFDVYEMEKDYSKWFVRYQVELKEVYMDSLRIEIMCIVRGEREVDSFLVFKTQVDGFKRFMKYKFADKSLKMLFQEVAIGYRIRVARQTSTPNILNNVFRWSKAFEFIQSISPV